MTEAELLALISGDKKRQAELTVLRELLWGKDKDQVVYDKIPQSEERGDELILSREEQAQIEEQVEAFMDRREPNND